MTILCYVWLLSVHSRAIFDNCEWWWQIIVWEIHVSCLNVKVKLVKWQADCIVGGLYPDCWEGSVAELLILVHSCLLPNKHDKQSVGEFTQETFW